MAQRRAGSNGHPRNGNGTVAAPRLFHRTKLGRIYHGDSLRVFADLIEPQSVDLVMTSPPFGLVRKKDYGNADAHEYLEWFRPFADCFRKAIKPAGSLVVDIGGAWIPGQRGDNVYDPIV